MTNLMKSTALIAALSLGTVAAAEGNFGFQTLVQDDSSITISLVRTTAAGVLAIYDYSGGEFGDLLGTADLNAGANSDVNVTLDPNNTTLLAALIYEGEVTTPDMATGWIELDVQDEM